MLYAAHPNYTYLAITPFPMPGNFTITWICLAYYNISIIGLKLIRKYYQRSSIMNELMDNLNTCCKDTCCADGCCSDGCNTGECSNSCCNDGCCSDSENCCTE